MELRTIYLLNVFQVVYFMIYHIYVGRQLKEQKGKYWTREDSAYFKRDGRLDKRLTFIVLLRFVTQGVQTLNMFYILTTSIASGINASIIFSIYATTSLICALVFYLVYHEKLTYKHVIGIVMVFLSVVLISNGDYNPSEETKEKLGIQNEEDRVSVMVPITFAFMNCFIFVFNSVLVREVRKTKISTS